MTPDPPVPADSKPGAGAKVKKLYLVWWVLGTLVQILCFLPWVWKRLHAKALLLTSGIFILLIFGVETMALYWQWWIWDPEQLLGPKVGLVPLEEFLLYFLVVPSLATIQGSIEVAFEKLSKGQGSCGCK